MNKQSQMVPAAAEAFQRLAAMRDRARLQAHLFSMDVRERWQTLEDQFGSVEHQLTRGEERAIISAAAKASELARVAEVFLDRHAAGELSLLCPARHVMTAALETCSPADTLNEAAQIMWEEDCGAVPVVDADGLLVGMISDRDVAMACYTQGASPAQANVLSSMSRAIYCARPEALLADVIGLMAAYKVRRIPITSEAGTLLGLVALADLFGHLPEERENSALEAALVDALVAISQRHGPSLTLRAAIAAE